MNVFWRKLKQGFTLYYTIQVVLLYPHIGLNPIIWDQYLYALIDTSRLPPAPCPPRKCSKYNPKYISASDCNWMFSTGWTFALLPILYVFCDKNKVVLCALMFNAGFGWLFLNVPVWLHFIKKIDFRHIIRAFELNI